MRPQRISGLIKRRRGKTTIRVSGVATAPDLVRREWNPTAAQPAVGRREIRAPSVRHFEHFWLYRAKGGRNHNPRVGGSSPSSGMSFRSVVSLSISSSPQGTRFVGGRSPRVSVTPPPSYQRSN